MIFTIVFWLSVFLILWTFFFYPLVILGLSRLRPITMRRTPYHGKVSMIIAAHNEEGVIAAKLDNCLQLDFGDADYEIIMVSDGSTDKTNEILARYAHASPHLRIITYEPRAGKAHALNVGFAQSSGDVLIFSDANVILDRDAPARLLERFADTRVGAVCGRILVRGRGDNEIAGESLYMRLEGMIQRAEARFGNMVGIDGALFALRRELFRELPREWVLDDFALAMEAVLAGQKIVYAEDARGVEEVEASTANEFRRKARIIAGGYQYLAWFVRTGKSMPPAALFSFFSRKVLRWKAPVFMITAFVTNIALMTDYPYNLFFAGQVIFYGVALAGLLLPRLRNNHFFYLPYYFCSINGASLVGLLRFILKRQPILWEKVRR